MFRSPSMSLHEHRRVDLQLHFRYTIRRDPRAARMLQYRLHIRSIVLAVDLPFRLGYVTLDPHDLRHLGQHGVGFPPGGVELIGRELSDFAFNDVARHLSPAGWGWRSDP